MSQLRESLQRLLNQCSAENGSNTPDFILANYLTDCLTAFDRAVGAREQWYGRKCPACTGPQRETVGMVCQTCGTDYAPSDLDTGVKM
jgi:hypothetical protein